MIKTKEEADEAREVAFREMMLNSVFGCCFPKDVRAYILARRIADAWNRRSFPLTHNKERP